MKKVIAILTIAIVLAGAVFAATNDTLTINANVPKVKPIFVMKGQLTGTGETNDATQKTANATLTSDLDISQKDISVAITIAQDNTAEENNKSKYKGAITLTITPTTLKLGNDQTALPSYSDGALKNVNGIGTAQNGSSITCNNTTKVVTLVLNYLGSSVQDADVASFTYTWEHDDNLPPGDGYTATVKLTYSVQ